MLSDTELVEAFLEASIRGQDVLLANKHFVAESRFGSNQLVSKQSGLLIKAEVQQQPVQFKVRYDSPKREWLHGLLDQHDFFTTGKQDDKGFCSYQYFPGKPGYDLNYKSARDLWKNWRTLYRMHENMAQAQKLLIKGGHDWEQIQRMSVNSNLLFIETLAGETTSHMDDEIVWLSEVPSDTPAQPAEAVTESGGFAADGFIS